MIPFLEGIALGASLIIAIGPQNAFVIQQGILRQHVFLAAFVCTLVDVVLIIVGAAGFGTLIAIIPSLKTYFLWCGILFLMGYGTLSLISSFKHPGDEGSLGKNESGYSTKKNRKSILHLEPLWLRWSGFTALDMAPPWLLPGLNHPGGNAFWTL